MIGGNIGDEGKKGRNSNNNNAEGAMSVEMNEAVKLGECKSGRESKGVSVGRLSRRSCLACKPDSPESVGYAPR